MSRTSRYKLGYLLVLLGLAVSAWWLVSSGGGVMALLLKPLLWLGWSVYTPDVEAMTLNNVGAAHLSLGRLEAATQAFEEALRIDPQYPIPVFNLAVIRQVQGDPAEAERLVEKATKLGYRQGGTDRLIQSAQAVLARVEGAGTASGAI